MPRGDGEGGDRRFVVVEIAFPVLGGVLQPLPQRHRQRLTLVRFEVGLDHGRVHVARAADGRRVAQLLRDLLDDLRDVPLRLGVAEIAPSRRRATAQRTVPAQVRKSLALSSSPLISRR